MTSERLPDGGLKRLRLSHVRAYAERRGWERGETFRNRVVVFGRGPDSLEQLIVPTNPDLDDFVELMQRVVDQLAEQEGRRSNSVLEDLLSLDVDTIRFSVRSTASERGTLPLEQGLALIDGARRSLLAAACTVLAPENRYHPRMSRAEAEEFIQACEIGQTERGSYTVTLRAPIGAVDAPADRPAIDQVPFARKATEALATSIAKIAHAIEQDEVDAVLQARRGSVQVTANLCEALLRMQPEREDSALAFSVSWAPSHPTHATASTVILRNEHFPVLNLMSHRLRGETVPQAAEFIAHVDELRGVMGQDGRRQGDIRLTLYHEDEAIKASASLSPEQYEVAVRAHVDGRRVVIRGILSRGARLSIVTAVQGFGPLEQQPLPPRIT